MDARRGWGFVQSQEKGLFTFYREQQEHSERTPSLSRDSPSFGRLQKLPQLTPNKTPNTSSHLTIHPSSSLPLHKSAALQAKPIPSPTAKLQRLRKLLLTPSQSAIKQPQSSPHSIVELTFDHSAITPFTPRKLKRHRHHQKGRAKTQVSPTSPLPHSTPLKQPSNKNNGPKQESLFNYFSQRPELPFKMKALVSRQSSSKRGIKTVQDLCHYDTVEDRNKWISLKPIIKPVPIQPSKPQGMTLSFWDYFQQRKKLLLDRYKKQRQAGRVTPPPTRPKPTLTNNHI